MMTVSTRVLRCEGKENLQRKYACGRLECLKYRLVLSIINSIAGNTAGKSTIRAGASQQAEMPIHASMNCGIAQSLPAPVLKEPRC